MAKLDIQECRFCGTDNEDDLVFSKNGLCTGCQADEHTAAGSNWDDGLPFN
jgi:hypothetical protein